MRFPINLAVIAIGVASLSACAEEDVVGYDNNLVIVETDDLADEMDNELLQAGERGDGNMSEEKR